MENGAMYAIKWDLRDQVSSRSMYEFYLSSEYCDVTLSAEGVLVPCHKLVLVSCSPYFDKIFKQNKCGDHPIIIFQDIKVVDLLSALCYAYTGEVEVGPENLSSLVNLLILFQLKGVSYVEGTAQSPQTVIKTKIQQTQPSDSAAEPSELAVEPQDFINETFNIDEQEDLDVTEPAENQQYEAVNEAFNNAFRADPAELANNDQQMDPIDSLDVQPEVNENELNESNIQVKQGVKKSKARRKSFYLNRSIIPGLSSICKQAQKVIKSRRTIHTPAHLQSFELNEGNVKKYEAASQFKKKRAMEECPICLKVLAKNYVHRHIKNVHGSV